MKEVRDILVPGLTIVFIGFNPGARSAETGHHFAGYSNKFWKLLHAASLTPRQLKAEEDGRLPEFGCGITNIVARPSRTAAEITKTEFREGRTVLREKLTRFKPLIACYAGIGVYREFAAKKRRDLRPAAGQRHGRSDRFCRAFAQRPEPPALFRAARLLSGAVRTLPPPPNINRLKKGNNSGQ